jgi:hypothetical protein
MDKSPDFLVAVRKWRKKNVKPCVSTTGFAGSSRRSVFFSWNQFPANHTSRRNVVKFCRTSPAEKNTLFLSASETEKREKKIQN